jgi:uncharacterized protein (DUF433 family)
MIETKRVVHSDPEIVSGTPVFVGTRVPIDCLIDDLQDDHALVEFREDFPTVTREQAIAALEIAREALKYEALKNRSARVT